MPCAGCQKRREQVHRIVEAMRSRPEGYGRVIRTASREFMTSAEEDLRRIRSRMVNANFSSQTKRFDRES